MTLREFLAKFPDHVLVLDKEMWVVVGDEEEETYPVSSVRVREDILVLEVEVD